MDVFERTIRGLDVGLKVGDIATFDLRTCDVDEEAGDVLAREDLAALTPPRAELGRVAQLESTSSSQLNAPPSMIRFCP